MRCAVADLETPSVDSSSSSSTNAEPVLLRVTQQRRGLRARHLAAALVLSVCLTFSQGCATFTGLLTGAFTGCIDAPAQVYRYNRASFKYHPEYWIFNVLLFFPLGLATGPLAGMVKGAALDIQWAFLDDVTYTKAFMTYRRPSIWRPFTIHWDH